MNDRKKKMLALSMMLKTVEHFIDDCGEVDCTRLAENTADVLDIYENDESFEIPDWLFDMAVTVAEDFAAQRYADTLRKARKGA